MDGQAEKSRSETPMYFLGIDPGFVSGAWGCIDHAGTYMGCGNIEHDDHRVLARPLRKALLGVIPDLETAWIVIEQVGPMPKQGMASTAKFMRAAGCIEAVAELTGFKVFYVTPQVWKKNYFLMDAAKNDSLLISRFGKKQTLKTCKFGVLLGAMEIQVGTLNAQL
jgi:Holliday junction resolvasome RuvABC endonuclease subunit